MRRSWRRSAYFVFAMIASPAGSRAIAGAIANPSLYAAATGRWAMWPNAN